MTFVKKGQIHKDLKTDPVSQNRIIHNDYPACTPCLLQDLAPIFWI